MCFEANSVWKLTTFTHFARDNDRQQVFLLSIEGSGTQLQFLLPFRLVL